MLDIVMSIVRSKHHSFTMMLLQLAGQGRAVKNCSHRRWYTVGVLRKQSNRGTVSMVVFPDGRLQISGSGVALYPEPCVESGQKRRLQMHP